MISEGAKSDIIAYSFRIKTDRKLLIVSFESSISADIDTYSCFKNLKSIEVCDGNFVINRQINRQIALLFIILLLTGLLDRNVA